jgi:hypothetical protein
MGRGKNQGGRRVTARPPQAAPAYQGGTSSFDTIYRSLWNYPSLYCNRNEVLENLFYHYGHGFDWVDGEIVGYYGPHDSVDPLELEPYDYVYESDHSDTTSATGLEIIANLRAERVAKSNWARDNADVLTRIRLPHPPLYRAFKEASPICLIPDDITPDWAQAAHEAIALALEADPATVSGERERADLIFNQACAREAQKRLHGLGFTKPASPPEHWTLELVLPLVQQVFSEGHEQRGCCLAPMLVAGDLGESGVDACRTQATTMKHPFCLTVLDAVASLFAHEREQLFADDSKEAYGRFHEPHAHELSYRERHPLSPEVRKQLAELLDGILNETKPAPPA